MGDMLEQFSFVHLSVQSNKLLTRPDSDKAQETVVPNLLSPRDPVFRLDIGHKLYHHHLSVQASI